MHHAGVTNVSFSTFASIFVLKVPWFTPGYSYCRWWGVTCCLTASESVLPTCTQGFQSVGMLSLTGLAPIAYICSDRLLSETAQKDCSGSMLPSWLIQIPFYCWQHQL